MWQLVLPSQTETIEAFKAAVGWQGHSYPMVFTDAAGPLGGFLFERYTGPGGSVTVHLASTRKGWARRGMFILASHYAFVDLKVAQMWTEIAHTNTAALATAQKAGFTHFTTLPGYFQSADLLVLCMKRDACRFLTATDEDTDGQG